MRRSDDNVYVVTPTLGGRASLSETVKSIKAFPVFHVLICPKTVEDQLRAVTGGAPSILTETRKGGVYGAVNDALLHCPRNYEWVAYINDDDYWLPSMLQLLERCRHTKADILYGRVRYIDKEGKSLGDSSGSRFYKWFPYLAARGIYIFTQQATLIRRSLFQKMGGFDESFSLLADNDFWIRAIQSGAKCEFVNEACAAYRMHDEQLSSDVEKGLAERRRMLEKYGLNRKSIRSILATLLYRLGNLPVYMRRLITGKRSIREAAGRGKPIAPAAKGISDNLE